MEFSPPPEAVRFAQWAAIMTGGLGLFVLLAGRRPRRPRPEPMLPAAGIVFPPSIDAAEPPGGAEPERRVLEDEANMPRWLRPSVQAARQGRYIRE